MSEEAALVIAGLDPIQKLVREVVEVEETVTRQDGPRERDPSLGGRRGGIPQPLDAGLTTSFPS